MVITTDEFIVAECVLLCVSSKPVISIWYRRWERVGNTEYLSWPICIGGVETNVFTVISCKHVL